MAKYLFTNNASSVLAADITDEDTSLSITPGDGALFPAADETDYFMVTLVDQSGNREIVKVTNRSTDTFTIVRAQEGTAARAFSIDDIVSHRFTAGTLEDFQDDINDHIDNTTTAHGAVSAATASKIVIRDADSRARFADPSDDADAATKGYVDAALSDADEFFSAGRMLYLYENVAPTGWTIESVTDRVLAVKGGSAAYDANGGTQAGTWTQPDHNHTGPSHTHGMQNHTHTGPSHTHTGPSHKHSGPSHTHSMQSHTHSVGSHTHTLSDSGTVSHGQSERVCFDSVSGFVYADDGGAGYNDKGLLALTLASTGNTGTPSTSNTGSGGTGNTGNAGTGNTGASGTGATGAPSSNTTTASGTGDTGDSATVNTWRPLAALGIIVSKDA